MEAQTINSPLLQNQKRTSLTLMKKIFILAGVLLLAGIAFGFYLYNKPHQGIGDETPAYDLKAEILINEYNTDEAKANEKYLGKVVAVSGVIAEKSKDKEGNISVTLQGRDLSGIGCQFEPDAQKNLAGLKEGQEIKIKGICTGVLMDVVLVDCVIENDNQ